MEAFKQGFKLQGIYEKTKGIFVFAISRVNGPNGLISYQVTEKAITQLHVDLSYPN